MSYLSLSFWSKETAILTAIATAAQQKNGSNDGSDDGSLAAAALELGPENPPLDSSSLSPVVSAITYEDSH